MKMLEERNYERMAEVTVAFIRERDEYQAEVDRRIADLERELEDQRDRFEERFEGLHYHVEERCDDIQEMVAQANSD